MPHHGQLLVPVIEAALADWHVEMIEFPCELPVIVGKGTLRHTAENAGSPLSANETPLEEIRAHVTRVHLSSSFG
jgi:hypothetical protein